jgi:hypothetical protein
MSKNDLSALTWRKSTHSGWTKDGNCVPEAVAVRDSKDPNGPALIVSPTTFTRFLHSLR